VNSFNFGPDRSGRPLGGSPLRILRDRAQDVRATFRGAYRFRGELRTHWRMLAGAFLFSLAFAAVRLAEPWPLKFIFDNVLRGDPLATGHGWIDRMLGGDRIAILVAAAIAILVLALLRGITAYYQTVMTSVVGQQVVLSMRQRLFAHMQRLSLSYHIQNPSGELLSRLTSDINQLRQSVVASLLTFFSNTVIVVGFLVIMFFMEWRLALMVVFVVPVLFGLMTVYSGRIRTATRQQRKQEGQLAGRLQEALGGIHLVQMFSREEEEDERLRTMNRQSFQSGLTADRLGARLNRVVELVLGVGTAATLFFGVIQVLGGRLTLGELVVFASYMQGFYRPLRQLSRMTQRASKAASSLERITDVLDRSTDVPDGPEIAPPFFGEIRFDKVDFDYQPGAPVLREVDLLVRPGQSVALVGPTGAGKSTLLALIPRLYDPMRGAVRIDGQDVRRFTLKSLRDQISIVPHEGMLFAASVRENIAFGRPGARDEEIEAAARAALIHDFIETLPDGYQTMLGERGVTLSGGQRQRLAIARAIVRDAPIVLLDEPTTGLDSRSEELVMEAMDRLQAGRTVVVIAHRLTTVRRAEVVFVVEGGRIVERGTHDELMALGGHYRRLYDLQFTGASSKEPGRETRPGPSEDARPVPSGNGEASKGMTAPITQARRSFDPELPQAPLMLDPEGVALVLGRSFDGAIPLEVDIRYLRYKPGTNLVVHYEVGVDGVRHEAVGMIVSGTYLARRATKPENVALARMAAPRSPAATPLAYDPEVDCLVQWYPLDLSLPALATPPSELREAISEAGVPVQPSDEEPERLAYKPRRRAVLRIDDWVLKLYAHEAEFERSVAGQRAASNLSAVVAPGLDAVLPERLATVQRVLPGETVTAAAELAPDAGAVLARLHGSRAEGLRVFDPAAQLEAAAASARLVSAIAPELRSRLKPLLAALEELLPEDAGLVPSHGDFNARQLLVVDGNLALTDFDAFCLAPAALDPATYVAYLVRGGPDDLSTALGALDHVVQGYGERPTDLSWYLATMILRRAPRPFRYFDADWRRRVARMVEASEGALWS
jgi:ABC-type multidrug transport system fused ATPase/permease subunit/Ser/Thr protein kinase RdoA (MazF antagonist)